MGKDRTMAPQRQDWAGRPAFLIKMAFKHCRSWHLFGPDRQSD
jgi:hypothetical protein